MMVLMPSLPPAWKMNSSFFSVPGAAAMTVVEMVPAPCR
jgi:hypothetical protein